MVALALNGIYAKLERTDSQIQQLAGMIEAFFMYWPVGQISTFDQTLDEDVWTFAIGSPILPDIPVVIGEVLHNIRSSLDLVISAVAKQCGGSGKGTGFPFGADATALEDQITQKCKPLPHRAVDLIRKWQPYKGGNDLLWAIHDLNRADKHREIVPVNLSTGSNSATYLRIWTGLALVIGHRNAQHLIVSRRSPQEIAEMDSPTAVYEVPPGTQLNFSTVGCTAEESLQFLRTTPGATFTTDMQPALDIAFKDTVGAPLEPVCSALTRMAREARAVIADFEKEFSKACRGK